MITLAHNLHALHCNTATNL